MFGVVVDEDDETIVGIVVPRAGLDEPCAGVQHFAAAECDQQVRPPRIQQRHGQIVGDEAKAECERDGTPFAETILEGGGCSVLKRGQHFRFWTQREFCAAGILFYPTTFLGKRIERFQRDVAVSWRLHLFAGGYDGAAADAENIAEMRGGRDGAGGVSLGLPGAFDGLMLEFERAVGQALFQMSQTIGRAVDGLA